MEWKKLVIFSIVLFFTSCINFYHHRKGGFRPKRPKFSLAKEKFVFNKLIDTTAVYVNIDTLKSGNDKWIDYLKFYNNGRLSENILDCIYIKDSTTCVFKWTKENLGVSRIGYYTLKDSVLTTEIFVTNYAQGGSWYIIEKGKVKGDTIFMENKIKDKDVYVKQNLDFIPEPSNW